jgi:amylosucrase
MGFALICSFGGIPLLYMGDEVGLLNDYDFVKTPEHAHDNRWLHRPSMDWKSADEAAKGKGPAAELLAGVKHIVAARKSEPRLSSLAPTRVIDVGNPKVFAFARLADEGTLLGLFNFTEQWTGVSTSTLRANGVSEFRDVLGGGAAAISNNDVSIAPYGRLWLI